MMVFPAFALQLGVLLAADEAPTPKPAVETPPVVPVVDDGLGGLNLEDLLAIDLSSAAKIAQSAQEAPGVATVITPGLAQTYDWTTLNDMLFAQPGFFPSQDYERLVVGLRGLPEGWNNNHLLLLIDGVPMNDNESGTAYTWDIMPLFFARQVEIIRGPGSALYGAYATNGVIAIETVNARRGVDAQGGLELNSQVGLRFGDHDTYTIQASLAASGRLFSGLAAFARNSTGGNTFREVDASGRLDDNGALREFDSNDQRSSNYLFTKLMGEGDLSAWSAQYHYQRWSYGTGLGWFYWAPDHDDPMQEERHLAVLAWRPLHWKDVRPEIVLRYQRHTYDLTVRQYPDGAFDGYYPDGATERIATDFDDTWLRAQVSWNVLPNLNLLAGVEWDAFLYRGDRIHFSNVALTEEDAPPVDGSFALGPLYEPVVNLPIHSMAAFAQTAWSNIFDTGVSLTAGLRYDLKLFRHRHDGVMHDRSFSALSPRVSLVWAPWERLALKYQISRAFRTPTPAESFGANSWTVSSDPDTIQAEYVIHHELVLDWHVLDGLSTRLVLFDTDASEQIGYAPDDEGDIGNLYSRRVRGGELEVMAESELGPGRLSGFANYSATMLVDETVSFDATPSNRLTWAPEQLGKAGLSYRWQGLEAAVQLTVMGPVRRRASDLAIGITDSRRPATVPAWEKLDITVSCEPIPELRFGASVKNVLDNRARIVKPGPYEFDFRLEGRRMMAFAEVYF